MNVTYDEEKKQFDIAWRTDTEHLEAALSAWNNSVVMLENTSDKKHKSLINNYLSENFKIILNTKTQALEVAFVEINFAETTIHLRPIKCRRKLKIVAVSSTLLLAPFPHQKNMIQINYKGKMHSMLLDYRQTSDKVMM